MVLSQFPPKNFQKIKNKKLVSCSMKFIRRLKNLTMKQLILSGSAVGLVLYVILASTGYDIFDIIELVFSQGAAQTAYWLFIAFAIICALFVVYVVIRGFINQLMEMKK